MLIHGLAKLVSPVGLLASDGLTAASGGARGDGDDGWTWRVGGDEEDEDEDEGPPGRAGGMLGGLLGGGGADSMSPPIVCPPEVRSLMTWHSRMFSLHHSDVTTATLARRRPARAARRTRVRVAAQRAAPRVHRRVARRGARRGALRARGTLAVTFVFCLELDSAPRVLLPRAFLAFLVGARIARAVARRGGLPSPHQDVLSQHYEVTASRHARNDVAHTDALSSPLQSNGPVRARELLMLPTLAPWRPAAALVVVEALLHSTSNDRGT